MRDSSQHSPRHRVLPSIVLALALAAISLPARAATRSAQILDVGWRRDGPAAQVTLRLSGPVRYRTAVTADVVRVDLWTVTGDADRVLSIQHGVASHVTVRRLTPEIVRVGISLRDTARFRVYTATDRLTVSVFPREMGTVPVPQTVSHQILRVPTATGRARVHVVTIDPRAGSVVVRPALGGAVVAAVETTSVTATRLSAVAAINGTYYSQAGLPLGLLVIDGTVLSTPLPRRPVFAVHSDGRPWIGQAEVSGRLVTATGRQIPISAVNRPPRSGGLAVYTPEFGPLTFTQSRIALVAGERIVAFTSGRPAIPADGYALAAAEFQQDLLAGLAVGDEVVLDLTVSPPGIQHAIQGGPLLVRDGQVFIPYDWEGFTTGFFRIRTARSAIGITSAGKVLFVAADARSRQNSGMNLPELAELMRSLGAQHAMNLDGGGSSTLVVGGRVVTAVPRGGERRVSSMVVALPRQVSPER
ncbi:MAG: phosphodiester glycosidase family protein [Armatimonadota bacterium]|nr:phosphodiester glycosidase family protein [Armatimonadota bacterium]